MFGTLFGILAVICAVWVIVDVATKQKKMKQNEKVLWIVLAVIFNILTAIVYFFVKKKK